MTNVALLHEHKIYEIIDLKCEHDTRDKQLLFTNILNDNFLNISQFKDNGEF